MGDTRLELEEQRRIIKRYEDLCAFGAIFSLLMLFNDGPARIAGYAIGIFAWFWWGNKSKRQELDRQIHQHEQAELITGAVATRSPIPADESPSPHSSSTDPRPASEITPNLEGIGGITRKSASSFGPTKSAGKVCPKCRHQRSENDDLHVPDWQCPSCGIAYAKFKPGQRQRRPVVPLEISTGRRLSSFVIRGLGWCLIVIAAILSLLFAMISLSESESEFGLAKGVILLLLGLGLPGLGLLVLAEIGSRRAIRAAQSRDRGENRTRPGEAKPQEGVVALLGMVVVLAVFAHIALAQMYGTMAPCRAAAKRIVSAAYDDMPPAETAAGELGRRLGQSWTQELFERLVYADMATGSVMQCYAVAFRVAKPVSRSQPR
jgi:ribosomal protein L37AE/L43A